MQFFFHHRNAVDVGAVIKDAYRLYDSTPDDIHPKRMIAEFIPLTKGQYPIFDKYPKFVVDYLVSFFEAFFVFKAGSSIFAMILAEDI